MKKNILNISIMNKALLSLSIIISILLAYNIVNIEAQAATEDLSSERLTIKAWEALSSGMYSKVDEFADKCLELYKKEAKREQGFLRKFPTPGETKNYTSLNNVATCIFIKGEALFQQKRYEEAKVHYNEVIANYGFAQSWDPKGWYWKVAEKSRAVLNKIKLILKPEFKKEVKEEYTLIEGINFPLYEEGSEDIVDYEKYGDFENLGTADYRYKIKDKKGLSSAIGVGIYPNNVIYRDPTFKEYMSSGLLNGNHWDFVNSDNLHANFYKWTTAGEDPGVKLFYTAHALERAMHYKHAIKAYYAIVMHYPKTISWTYWKTPWYVGQVAIDKINYLTRKHPDLGMKLEGAEIVVENGFDYDVTNDVVIIDPGKIVKCEPSELQIKPVDLSEQKVIKKVGGPKVELVQYENRHWQMKVDGEPIIVKSIAYTPTVIGQSPDKGTLKDWTFEDHNGNGKIDGPYDAWVDKNQNNRRDAGEEIVGDFKLLKDMGANSIRIYHHDNNKNKELYKALYEDYGIMLLMGDFLGAYAIGSGATWHNGTDYSNPEHQENMKKSVMKMLEDYKDEPYIMMWVLGNENNYGVANNAKTDPVNYFKFVNEVAEMIKEIDPTRPIALCNGDILFLDIFAQYCPSVDIYGANSYRGEQGFGPGMWGSVKRLCDKPVLITEYGCPAYQKGKPREISEVDQAKYHQGEWEDILYNSAGYGQGNSIGGVIFEYVDEWWKAYEPDVHDREGLYTGPFPGGVVYEEWFGIVGQGDGTASPYMRQLRESYFLYKRIWNE